MFNLTPKNQFRLVVSSRRDYYQIPVSTGAINEVDGVPGAISSPLSLPARHLRRTCSIPGGIFQSDGEHEADTFVNFSWVRTLSPNALLTVSPLVHYNSANYNGNPSDLPTDTTDNRSSIYAGGQATVNWTVARNTLSAGIYGFWQHDNQLFGVVYCEFAGPIGCSNPGNNSANFTDSEPANGSLQEVWIEDKFKITPWLTLSGGVRQAHFSATVTENATSPRAGISLRIPKINWVLHGFYGRFYQAPPLLTFSGPPLVDAAASQGFNFGFLRGERDEEYQFGVTMPYKGWNLDADTFRTRANNFFDHNNLGESNVFIPVTLTDALVRGWELTLRSPSTLEEGSTPSGLLQSDCGIPRKHYGRPDSHRQCRNSKLRASRPRPAKYAERRPANQPALERVRFRKCFLRLRLHQRQRPHGGGIPVSVARPSITCRPIRWSIFPWVKISARSFRFPRVL